MWPFRRFVRWASCRCDILYLYHDDETNCLVYDKRSGERRNRGVPSTTSQVPKISMVAFPMIDDAIWQTNTSIIWSTEELRNINKYIIDMSHHPASPRAYELNVKLKEIVEGNWRGEKPPLGLSFSTLKSQTSGRLFFVALRNIVEELHVIVRSQPSWAWILDFGVTSERGSDIFCPEHGVSLWILPLFACRCCLALTDVGVISMASSLFVKGELILAIGFWALTSLEWCDAERVRQDRT